MSGSEKRADFSGAVERSTRIRKLYHELENRHHGSPWTNQEDFIAFARDVGELGRTVMASEGRWVYEGDPGEDLPGKLAECLWWVFVLSDRLGIDISNAFSSKMAELEEGLSACLAKK